jgi:hypothetical protein
MKRLGMIAVALVMVVGIGIGSASAANSLQQGKISIGVGMGDSYFNQKKDTTGTPAAVNDVVDLSARYLITKDLAIIGGFGLQIGSGDVDSTYFSFTGGVRKYLRTTDFAPFVGGQLTYATYKAEDYLGATTDDQKIMDLSAMFGAEYFVGPQFSLEGSVGIGMGQFTDNVNANSDYTYFGSRTVGVKANFYF